MYICVDYIFVYLYRLYLCIFVRIFVWRSIRFVQCYNINYQYPPINNTDLVYLFLVVIEQYSSRYKSEKENAISDDLVIFIICISIPLRFRNHENCSYLCQKYSNYVKLEFILESTFIQ